MELLTEVLQVVDRCMFSVPLAHQVIERAVIHMSVSACNRLLQLPRLSVLLGFRAKLAISQIQQWLPQSAVSLMPNVMAASASVSKAMFESTAEHFAPVIELANALVVLPNTPHLTVSEIQELFPSLSGAQLRRIVDIHEPTEYACFQHPPRDRDWLSVLPLICARHCATQRRAGHC